MDMFNTDELPDWARGMNCGITVCDASGKIIYMNDKALSIFASHGDMRGRNLMPCHSERSKGIIADMLTTGRSNCYTIQKNGICKIIFQTPWRTDGKISGLVEISMEVPWDMPHYNRDVLPFSPEAFLFDLDGVIVDSEKVYTTIWEQINAAYPTGVEGFATKIKGTTLSNILSTYYPDPSEATKVEQMLYDLEGKMKFPVIPGALKLLNKLKELNIPAALVTSSNEVKMAHLWSQHPELKGFFDVIVTADLVTKSKPDPEGYLKAAELLGKDPKKCVVVEDSLQGVMAGTNAGAFVIGVPGTLSADTLRPHSNMQLPDLGRLDL